MRPLTLHASALNDDEYALYTSSVSDLALCDDTLHDDRFYEEITISVREAQAWLRGRYPDIPVATIDTILKFFSPTLGQADTLSGGQFFAALRLVVHAQNRSQVDRSLAFVQARPSLSFTASVHAIAGSPQLPRRSADSDNNPFTHESGHQLPVHLSQHSESGVISGKPNNPFVTRSKSLSSRSEAESSTIPPLPPRKPSTSVSSLSVPPPPRHASTLPPIPPPLKPKPVISPLIQQSLMASKTAKTMKKAEEQLEKERVLQVLRSSAVSSPFMNGSREASPSKRVLVTKSDSSASSWSGSEDRDKPPALPRRPRHSPTVSTTSLEQVALAAPPTSTPHTASPFDSPARLAVDLPPPTHPDRKPPSFPPTSTHIDDGRSFESIYGTSQRSSPTPSPLSPSSPSTSKPSYRFSVESATPATPTQQQSRVFRSRSLHYHPTTTAPTNEVSSDVVTGKGPPPIPPPKPPVHSRRKRPESLQVMSSTLPNGGESLGIFGGSGPATATTSSFVEAKNSIFAPSPTSNLGHRRSSHSSPFGGNYSSTIGVNGDTTTAGAIQRKLQEFQLNAMPALEKARYKAEAGLSPRRGFIPTPSSVNGAYGTGGVTAGGKSLSGGRPRVEEREGLLSRDEDDEVGQDSGDDDGGDRCGTLRGKEWRAERSVTLSRDEMKWPPGDGWNRL